MRCVLWHSGSAELPGELLASLSKRVGSISVCTDAYVALTQACLVERDHRRALGAMTESSLKNHSARTTAGLLVLVQPELLAGVPEIMESVRLYAPSVARWCYDRGATPRLRTVTESEIARWAQTSAAVAPATSPTPAARAPAVRTTETHRSEPAPAPRPGRSLRLSNDIASEEAGLASRRPAPSSIVTSVYSSGSMIAGPNITPRLRLAGTPANGARAGSSDQASAGGAGKVDNSVKAGNTSPGSIESPSTPAGAASRIEQTPGTRAGCSAYHPIAASPGLSTSGVLTDEELRMLLSDETDGENRANGTNPGPPRSYDHGPEGPSR